MKRTIGIIGGMGPAATCDLYKKIIDITNANLDQDHLHIIVDSNPEIPDRTQYILNYFKQNNLNSNSNNPLCNYILANFNISNKTIENPLPFILKSAKMLEDDGAEIIAMPCNTSHYFQEIIINSIKSKFISITGSVAQYIINKKFNKVAILATDGTICADVYGKVFNKHNIDCVYPSCSNQKVIMDIIYKYVKQGNLKDLPLIKDDFLNLIEDLMSAGAQAIVLACTELPIAFRAMNVSGLNIIDTNYILAKTIVEASQS